MNSLLHGEGDEYHTLQIQFQKQVAPDESGMDVNVTTEAIPKGFYGALPHRPLTDQNLLMDRHHSDEAADQSWSGFIHMIREGDQDRILGFGYVGKYLLMCMRGTYPDFVEDETVSVYVGSIWIAYEFHLGGSAGGFCPAVDLLVSMASSPSSVPHRSPVPEREALTKGFVDEDGTQVSVRAPNIARPRCSVRRTPDVDMEVTDEIMERLKLLPNETFLIHDLAYGDWVPGLVGENVSSSREAGDSYVWRAWADEEARANFIKHYLRQMDVPETEMPR